MFHQPVVGHLAGVQLEVGAGQDCWLRLIPAHQGAQTVEGQGVQNLPGRQVLEVGAIPALPADVGGYPAGGLGDGDLLSGAQLPA